jgi:ribosomal protein L21
MKVFKDIISGDELCSDSYPHKVVMEDACLEVKARYVKKGGNQIAIASDDIIEEDENAPTVVDIVDSFQLNEIQMTKKDFMSYIKGFLAAVTAKLEATGKSERVPLFKKGATELTKLIVSRFDEFQIYTGQSYNMEGALAFSYQKEQEDDGPTFLYFKDVLKEEKF